MITSPPPSTTTIRISITIMQIPNLVYYQYTYFAIGGGPLGLKVLVFEWEVVAALFTSNGSVGGAVSASRSLNDLTNFLVAPSHAYICKLKAKIFTSALTSKSATP